MRIQLISPFESSIGEDRMSMHRAGLVTTVALGIAATAVVALPTLLVGGLAVVIGEELSFGETELGIAIATSFAAAALAAAPAGRLAEHIGPRRTTWIGLGCAAISMLGIGLVADSWIVLVGFLAIAGIGITTVQLGVNVLLARGVPSRRQGLAFGTKQAAVPLASLLAGLALPLIGLTLGWQVAFVMAAMLVPFVAWRLPDAPPGPGRQAASGEGDAPLGTLILLTAGVALASAGGNSTPAFIVPSLVDRGFEPGHAGLVLAGGSVVGIVVRVLVGWLSDRLGTGSLLIVMSLIAAGVVGFVGLALTDHPALMVIFTALAFGGGWGWGGLIPLAVTRTNPQAPGRAMGIVQVGPMSGAVVGPVLFGTLAERVAFGAAWSVMALLAGLGLVTILVSRRRLVRAQPTGAGHDR
jgi:MFS family permease